MNPPGSCCSLSWLKEVCVGCVCQDLQWLPLGWNSSAPGFNLSPLIWFFCLQQLTVLTMSGPVCWPVCLSSGGLFGRAVGRFVGCSFLALLVNWLTGSPLTTKTTSCRRPLIDEKKKNKNTHTGSSLALADVKHIWFYTGKPNHKQPSKIIHKLGHL